VQISCQFPQSQLPTISQLSSTAYSQLTRCHLFSIINSAGLGTSLYSLGADPTENTVSNNSSVGLLPSDIPDIVDVFAGRYQETAAVPLFASRSLPGNLVYKPQYYQIDFVVWPISTVAKAVKEICKYLGIVFLMRFESSFQTIRVFYSVSKN
jgi:hypothetical protein